MDEDCPVLLGDFIVVLMAGYCLPVCICLCLCPNPQLAPELCWLDWWCHIVGELLCLLPWLLIHSFNNADTSILISLFSVHLVVIYGGS